MGDKQILKNYRPISLLSITGKILEMLLYNRMFEFFTKNNFISDNQLALKLLPMKFINLLIIILKSKHGDYLHGQSNIFILLDISKAFDKVLYRN